ncbi:prepilin-type N-terminal cleavage/methylation domain-containing protein [Coraliomargarita akajimensis]|uniref:Type II secretion pathway protein XcpT n=1 Tax=Coraliomargarita akajimensis (strain DSM 45221 / IAM 15411 / JCM 23193 / KCTC 12865 / 04OKA010-24) TaxID=583355 RepID=D5EHY6_CORAD|nr:prepilin-type N-terminal cleavage/methylation domain-containing protein [Coraliomargarita akajimensis]ADE56026.1 type II secretion pathway protein XcpT [Coraliomargarita akajimensis DSM 45221]
MIRKPDDSQELRRRRRSGFTLIELLLVVSIILVLAGITFGVSRGVQNSQARARAKAELAVLAQALEAFKTHHGDYPWTNPSKNGGLTEEQVLSKALLGYMEFRKDSSGNVSFMRKQGIPNSGPKSFMDPTKIEFIGSMPKQVTQEPDIKFVDPWGGVYQYKYKHVDNWENFGFVLYSTGADLNQQGYFENNGLINLNNKTNSANKDNILYGE